MARVPPEGSAEISSNSDVAERQLYDVARDQMCKIVFAAEALKSSPYENADKQNAIIPFLHRIMYYDDLYRALATRSHEAQEIADNKVMHAKKACESITAITTHFIDARWVAYLDSAAQRGMDIRQTVDDISARLTKICDRLEIQPFSHHVYATIPNEIADVLIKQQFNWVMLLEVITLFDAAAEQAK
jgi:predicted HAD superfamily Cof-like phosphohydrolase